MKMVEMTRGSSRIKVPQAQVDNMKRKGYREVRGNPAPTPKREVKTDG